VCNVNAQNIYGWTALICASRYFHIEIVKLILQKDSSSIDIQNVEYKQTALMFACEQGHAAVIELLIRSGANTDLKDTDNETAFQILDERGGRLSHRGFGEAHHELQMCAETQSRRCTTSLPVAQAQRPDRSRAFQFPSRSASVSCK
jgi:hypothetical protein